MEWLALFVSAFTGAFSPRCTICNWRYPKHQLNENGICHLCGQGIVKPRHTDLSIARAIRRRYFKAKK